MPASKADLFEQIATTLCHAGAQLIADGDGEGIDLTVWGSRFYADAQRLAGEPELVEHGEPPAPVTGEEVLRAGGLLLEKFFAAALRELSPDDPCYERVSMYARGEPHRPELLEGRAL